MPFPGITTCAPQTQLAPRAGLALQLFYRPEFFIENGLVPNSSTAVEDQSGATAGSARRQSR